MQNEFFDIKVSPEDGSLLALSLSGDNYKMNWIEGKSRWGQIVLKDGYGNCVIQEPKKIRIEEENVEFYIENLKVLVKRSFFGEYFTESYIFENISDTVLIYGLGDIGICTPFNDNYQEAQVCLKSRCHTHIWCGGECSYVNAVRMGGEAPHLGLVLTKGAVGGYGIRENGGNDRGDFVLFPDRFELKPNDKYEISWKIFSHSGDDFYKKAQSINKLCGVGADEYTLFFGEKTMVRTLGAKAYYNKKILQDNSFKPECLGEHKIEIYDGTKSTFIRINCIPNLLETVQKRCRFISEKQQCWDFNSMLYGAYLAYDNEAGEQVYSNCADKNSGRERTGMGSLLALYLQNNKDETMEKSLRLYEKFVKKELFDEKSGIVYNDAGRNNVWHRLYNYPWLASFFLEMFKLFGKREYLINMVSVIKAYYENGGARFYCIGMPMIELVEVLRQSGMISESEQVLDLFKSHIECIIEIGTDYPKHEVRYEQSIVAPAVIYLLQGYLLTGEKRYINEAKKHLKVLNLFCGMQPDYHLNNISIRHWDGYWFGKRRMYADTFPHYWSTLTAVAYKYYFMATGEEEYNKKANTILRNNLCLFKADGSASCAYIYPYTVNSQYGRFYDPWANDQDWALVYAIKFLER